MSSPSISVMNCGRAFSFASHLAPVVICRPIAREFLNRRELHALRLIRDRFPFRPPCRVDAPAQFGQFRFRNIHMKRTNRGLVSTGCGPGLLVASGCGLVALDWLKAHGNLLTETPVSVRAHETRRATSDLSDEGIDDTFVSVRIMVGLRASILLRRRYKSPHADGDALPCAGEARQASP